ncbi:MAG: glycoside hydrolase family 125 protein [Sphingomonas sp.]|nr:glycoside hydrolase family 125 protein [Sphingomonas sp.]
MPSDNDAAAAGPSRRIILTMGAAVAVAGTAMAPRRVNAQPWPAPNPLAKGRPAPALRKFRSQAVDAAIARLHAVLDRPGAARQLATLFDNCYPNTLDTTVFPDTINNRPDTFVITGDIDAMWLRDSAAQVEPYLRFAAQDAPLRQLIAGVINRQTQCVLIDPYANAFNRGPTGSPWANDKTDMKPELHERKFEVDSLCYTVRLAHGFWKATGDVSCFDADWQRATRLIVATLRTMQRKHGMGPYHFQRVTDRAQDTAPNNGFGAPTRPVGLIASIFRPSDDACVFPFLIPSNMMAVVALRQLAEMYRVIVKDAAFAVAAEAFAAEVDAAIRTHAIVDHPRHGRVFAFEIDGFGSQLIMDDANAPSLMSAPYLGYCKATDPVYRNTRALLLSADNPWYFSGTVADGIGSLHTVPGHVWPLAIIMRGLTSTEPAEIATTLRHLMASDGGTGFMHEAFDKDDPTQFSRPWFAWANGLFGALVLKIADEHPAILAAL